MQKPRPKEKKQICEEEMGLELVTWQGMAFKQKQIGTEAAGSGGVCSAITLRIYRLT